MTNLIKWMEIVILVLYIVRVSCYLSCAMGCVAKHYGCHCDQVCSCNRWFDCDDGPRGSGACTCQYGKWDKCNKKSPLKPENVLKKQHRCIFEIRSLKNLTFLDSETSRQSRHVFAMVAHVLPTRTGVAVERILKNKRLAKFLFLNDKTFSDYLPCLSGEDLCDGSRPYAHGYNGHQFGSFAGQLGDGRAITIGHTADGTFEVSLKGAGRTPFSRFGDGMASLYSVTREFLGSVYLKSIGIPVINSLAVIRKMDQFIYRDEWYTGKTNPVPAGVLVRVGESFLRFGSIQHAAKQVGFVAVLHVAKDALKIMYTMDQLPHEELKNAAKNIADNELKRKCFFVDDRESRSCASRYSDLKDVNVLSCLLEVVSNKSAALVAVWMSVGFAHGVMNTDNMSLIGKTIDLNVYGFITHYDNWFTPNFIDTDNRYAFGQQKKIMKWNLRRLSDALCGSRFLNDNTHTSKTWMKKSNKWLKVSKAQNILENFDENFDHCFQARMEQRLGLQYSNFSTSYKKIFMKDLLHALQIDGINYHYFSRNIPDIDVDDFKSDELRLVTRSLRDSILDLASWKKHVHTVVPSYSFNNNQIANLLHGDRFSPIKVQDVLDKFYDPFGIETNLDMYSNEKVVQTSCGGQ